MKIFFRIFLNILIVGIFVFAAGWAPSAKAYTSVSLSNAQIQNLANLYQMKINQEKIVNNLKKRGQSSVSAQADLNKKISALQAAMTRYKVPLKFQAELDEINSKNPSWIANFNPIFLKSDEEKKKLTGLKIDEATQKRLNTSSPVSQRASSAAAGSSLPDFFDWRNQSGKNYITPIKNQLSCGSCWAFAVVSAFEGEINAYYNSNLNKDFSEQDIVSCSGAGSCAGGSPNLAFDYIKNNGIAEESCFPYSAQDVSCSNKCPNWQSNAWKITGYNNISFSVDAIKNALIENGPIVTGMEVYYDFFSYSQGIYHHISGGLAGYHAVTIVGYGKNDGKDYWIVKNSWGTSWGEGGYFRIYAGDSSIDSFLEYAIQQPVPPSPVAKICEDKDNDGYCNWGLGLKPLSGCPVCDGAIKDCDDSNASIYRGCGISTQKTGSLNISSNPSSANVYVQDLNDGSWIYRGQTSLLINLNIGQRNIKITKEDYLDNITSINVVEGQETLLNITLVLAPKIISPLNNDILRAGDIIDITGSSGGDSGFKNYKIEWSKDYGSLEPRTWSAQGITLVNNGQQPVSEGKLGQWDTSFIIQPDFYTLKLTSRINGVDYIKYSQSIYLDPTLKPGWPQKINYTLFQCPWGGNSNSAITTAKYYSYIESSFQNKTSSQQVKTITNTNKSSSGLYSVNLNSFEAIGDTCMYWAGNLAPVVSDINNDGKKEIIVYKGGNPPEIWVYNADGKLLWKKGILGDPGSDGVAGGNLHIPLVGDINNDGYDEIIVSNPNFNVGGDNSILYALKNDGSVLWRVQVPKEGQPTMLMADIDNDGNKEIIIKGNQQPGIAILDKNGNLISHWDLPAISWGASLMPSPAVGNFDNDNDLEIVYISVSPRAGYDREKGWINEAVMYVFNKDGSVVDGWPIYLPGSISSSPVVGDINKDGKQEIVVGFIYASNTFPDYDLGGLYAIDRNGKILPGWPVQKGWNFWSTPALADIDNDGDLEISASKLGAATYLFQYDGSIVSGWPQYTSWNDYYGSIIGDITQDNKLDILTTAGNGFYSIRNNGGVYAWNNNGLKITGFPKLTEVDAQAPAVINDIDNDGKIELIASSDWDFDFISSRYKNRGSIYVWEIDKKYNKQNMPWPTFMHDNQHTGCYDCVSSPAATCTDSDSGKDYYVKGTVVLKGLSESDYCSTQVANTLVEMSCLDSYTKEVSNYVCPNGCENGACIQSSVRLLFPNGGETWEIGKTYNIKWTGLNIPSDGAITIAIHGTSVPNNYYIFSEIDNSGVVNWTIPNTIASDKYKMRVFCGIKGTDRYCSNDGTLTSNPNAEDWSDNYFSIVAATTVTCTDTDNGKDYFTKGTVTLKGLSESDYCSTQVANTLVEMSCLDANTKEVSNYVCPNGCENGACKQATAASITVTSPNGGETWKVGETHDITWTSSGIDNVSIGIFGYDSAGTRTNPGTIYGGAPAANGKYTWTIPSDYATFTNKERVKIYLLGYGANIPISTSTIYDLSDNYFSIVAPTPTPTPTCTDTDSGRDYYTKGTVIDKYGTYTDLCYAAISKIFEYYCDSTLGYSQGEWYTCPNGCENGACKSSPTGLNNYDQLLASISAAIAKIAEQIKEMLKK